MSAFDIFCFFFGISVFYYIRSRKLRGLVNRGIAWGYRKALHREKDFVEHTEPMTTKGQTPRVRLGKADISMKDIESWMVENPDLERDNPALAELVKGARE